MAVGIVNYNTCDLLRSCLQAAQLEAPSELVVVDNASSDGSNEMVRNEFPNVRLIENEINLGFGAAANQAIAHCRAEYVLLLNSDTFVQAGALGALSNYLAENPQVAIVGPRLVNSDGTLQQSCFPFPTPLDIFLDVTNTSRLIGHLPMVKELYVRSWSHNHSRRVPWVLGAALAIRREAFDAVGGMNESFYMFYEEVDLCYRLQKIGWQVHFAPVTYIVHVGGASTQQRMADMKVQFYASLVRFYHCHYSLLRRVELAALIESIALARLIRDGISLRLTRDSRKRANLAANIQAWQRLLLGQWRKVARD